MADLLSPSVDTSVDTISATADTTTVGSVVPAVPGTTKVEFFCKTAGQGMWFYDRLEQNTTGPTIYRHLLEQAERYIRIWDTYLFRADADLFNNISADTDIWILSFCDATNVRPGLQEFFDEMIILHSINHFGLKIAVIDKNKLYRHGITSYGNSFPHDRFLFIDDRAFIVGSSLQYHSVENARFGKDAVSTTMIYEIKDTVQCTFLLNEYNSYWNTTSTKYQYVTELFP